MMVARIACVIVILACQESTRQFGRVEGAVFVNREGIVLKASGGDVLLVRDTATLHSSLCAVRDAYDSATARMVDSVAKARERGHTGDPLATGMRQLTEYHRYHDELDSVLIAFGRLGVIDLDSRYRFDSVPSGRYFIVARKSIMGDKTEWMDTLLVGAGDTVRRDLASPVALPPALSCETLSLLGDTTRPTSESENPSP